MRIPRYLVWSKDGQHALEDEKNTFGEIWWIMDTMPRKRITFGSFLKKKKKAFMLRVGRDSSVGIATGYGVGGLGIESRWRRVLPHLFRQALGAIQPPV